MGGPTKPFIVLKPLFCSLNTWRVSLCLFLETDLHLHCERRSLGLYKLMSGFHLRVCPWIQYTAMMPQEWLNENQIYLRICTATHITNHNPGWLTNNKNSLTINNHNKNSWAPGAILSHTLAYHLVEFLLPQCLWAKSALQGLMKIRIWKNGDGDRQKGERKITAAIKSILIFLLFPSCFSCFGPPVGLLKYCVPAIQEEMKGRTSLPSLGCLVGRIIESQQGV